MANMEKGVKKQHPAILQSFVYTAGVDYVWRCCDKVRKFRDIFFQLDCLQKLISSEAKAEPKGCRKKTRIHREIKFIMSCRSE